MSTCPSCHGARFILGGIVNGTTGAFKGVRRTLCATCNATGSISEEFHERIKRGIELRADRLKRGLTVDQEAQRLNLKPYQVSDLENGVPNENP